tara:strand:+ start:241 stop:654 length:414 start_codon:yes stop_codon:yes gene_type:complete
LIENDLSLEHRKKINDFIILKSKDTLWSKFVLMLGIQMKTGLDPKIIVSIENKDIDETNRSIKLPNKPISFSKPNDDDFWYSIMERKSDSKYLFYRTRIQFYPRYKYSLEVDQDLDLPTSPEFFKRRFKQMKSVLNL